MPVPLQIKVMVANNYHYKNCHAVTASITGLISGSFNIPNRLHFQVSEFLDSQISRFFRLNFPNFQIRIQIHSGNLEKQAKKSGNLES